MDIPKAIKFAVSVYLLSLVLSIFVLPLSGVQLDQTVYEQTHFWLASTLLLMVLSAVAAYLYFRNNESQPSLQHGLYFGMVIRIVSMVLDILVLLSQQQSGDPELDFPWWRIYMSYGFLCMTLGLFVTTMGIGYLMQSHQKHQ
ncbi:MAG: hypothetical protein H6765_01235 [Candidatus Peribacteria bacterium]|nr:MAG: hypothetical protein H6765_01235 [Candidatus Peribacteria bacterium]